METMKKWLITTETKLDLLGARLKQREICLPVDLAAAGLFFVAALVLLLLMPRQIMVKASDVVNGRVFPTYLCAIMMVCSGALILKDLLRIAKKQPIATKTVNLLTEGRAAVIFAIMLLFYLVCRLTNLFVVGAVVCALGFLLFFRCKKPLYYLITLTLAVGIWVIFRFLLNVYF